MAFLGLQARLLRTWRPGPRALAGHILLNGIVAYISLAVAIWVVPGVSADGPPSIVAGVVLIGLLNALLRPILLWIAIPLGILGVAILGDGAPVHLRVSPGAGRPGHPRLRARRGDPGRDRLRPRQHRDQLVPRPERRRVVLQPPGPADDPIRRRAAAGPPASCSSRSMASQRRCSSSEIRAGRVPTMARWLRTATHRLTPWECQLPSQTSASQAGILLGANDGIPAFRWFEKETGRLLVSNRPADATEIERRLSNGDRAARARRRRASATSSPATRPRAS